PPELPAFVEAYRAVGGPRITVFVNRTLRSESPDDEYLKPGQYDEVQARGLDYEAIENILTDWLSADGQVTIVSPSVARKRLTDQEMREVQQGDRRGLDEAANQLGVDILVRVQAHPTKQTEKGLEVRIVAEALNTKGGESLSRAV